MLINIALRLFIVLLRQQRIVEIPVGYYYYESPSNTVNTIKLNIVVQSRVHPNQRELKSSLTLLLQLVRLRGHTICSSDTYSTVY